jgi:hypothetical protein
MDVGWFVIDFPCNDCCLLAHCLIDYVIDYYSLTCSHLLITGIGVLAYLGITLSHLSFRYTNSP